jgi:HlyD family secretion protein
MVKKLLDTVKRRRLPLGIFLLIVAGGVVTLVLWNKKADASDYLMGKVERGNVEVNVTATGTVQAVVTVQVGSQVSGIVSWLGADFNSHVKKGEIVARLDPAVLQAQVDTAKASLTNAEAAFRVAETEGNNQKANLAAVKANREVARVQREDAVALVNRYREIRDVISGRDVEAAQAQANAAAARYEQANAQVGQAEASIEASRARLEQAKADISRAKAQLDQAKVNLEHATIASPIDGVVVSRNVDVGQTVAASLSAPTLFTIANDLTKMQVLASIDEADVGQIKEGIDASFNVDAFPGETFTGRISQIRLNAQTTQNVVIYTAVIDVSNPNLKLRPGMTANITVSIARRENVLTVPNTALRFSPANLSEEEKRQKIEARRQEMRARWEAQRGDQGQQGQQGQADQQQGEQQRGPRADQDQPQGQGGQVTGGQGQGGQGQGSSPGGARRGGGGEGGGQRRQGQTVWVLVENGKVEPRLVRTGLTNGRVTELMGGELKEGEAIIIGQNDTSGRNRNQTSTPFGQRSPMGGPRGR